MRSVTTPAGTPAATSGGRAFSRLFTLFAVASLVQVTLLGVMLVRGYSEDAVAEGLQRGRAQAKLIQEMVISPAVTTDDLVLAPDELRRVRTAIRAAIFHGSVVRLLLRDRSGRVVVSDDETERTVEPADAEGLAAAARATRACPSWTTPCPRPARPASSGWRSPCVPSPTAG
nr:hypothetical protein GCM10020093_010960 [Planobispora longispora]